jgi:hypothetical protein
MWDLWWTKRNLGRFSPSTSVFPANSHSNDYSTLVKMHAVLTIKQHALKMYGEMRIASYILDFGSIYKCIVVVMPWKFWPREHFSGPVD